MEDKHDISELISWYQRYANTIEQDNHPAEDFSKLQDLAADLKLLQDCFPNTGSVSVVESSAEETNLSVLHRAITVSSNSTYALRFLFNHSVRKFYTNFSLHEVNGISARRTAKVTQMELLVVLNRMLTSQEKNIEYPHIFEDDLPYRSRSWVLSLIQYLESEYIGRMCLTEDFKVLNNLVGRVISVIDFYETRLDENETRFLNNLIV